MATQIFTPGRIEIFCEVMCDNFIPMRPDLLSFVAIGISDWHILDSVLIVVAHHVEHEEARCIFHLVIDIFVILMWVDIGQVFECLVAACDHDDVEEVTLTHEEVRKPGIVAIDVVDIGLLQVDTDSDASSQIDSCKELQDMGWIFEFLGFIWHDGCGKVVCVEWRIEWSAHHLHYNQLENGSDLVHTNYFLSYAFMMKSLSLFKLGSTIGNKSSGLSL